MLAIGPVKCISNPAKTSYFCMHVMYGMVYLVLNTALLCSRESNQQKLMGGGSGQMVSTGPKSLLSQSYQLRMDRRYVS